MPAVYSDREKLILRLGAVFGSADQWDRLCELFRFDRSAALERLVNATDPRDVVTIQAQIKLYDRLLTLKDELKRVQAKQ